RAVLPVWIVLIRQAQICLVDQRRSLQCVVGRLAPHLMMSEASKFLIDQRSQFREGSIVALTPARQELGHSLLRDRRRIHNLFHTLPPQESFCTRRRLRKNLKSNDHFDRSFAFMAMKTNNETKEKKGKTMNPLTQFKKILILRNIFLSFSAILALAITA